jgi:hypothetical protein
MDDLNDSLEGLFGGGEARPAPRLPDHYVSPVERVMRAAQTYSEPCGKCHGTGEFVGYSGRRFGPCFACKGRGKHEFKTSPEVRSKRNAQAAAKRMLKAVEKAQELEAWKAEHADEVAWLEATAARQQRASNPWGFPGDLLAKLHQYGSLTEGQLAAVRKFMLRDAERAAEREAAKAAAPTVDASKIEEAFAKVREAAREDGEGVKWLKVWVGEIKFLDAPASNGYAAAILVRKGDRKLGAIRGGKWERNRFQCDDATDKEVVEAIADPAGVARAYGQRTGTCCVCARELTNADSRAAGIGPICAERWGF